MSEFFRWLVPGLLAGGPHPDPWAEPGQLERALAEFRAHRIGIVISLCETPLRLPEGADLDYFHAPTPDGEAPENLEALCHLVDAAKQRGVGAFVHCQAGHGRTGTALAAYLIWAEGHRAWEAVDLVRARYSPRAVETPAQLAALEAFARRHKLI